MSIVMYFESQTIDTYWAKPDYYIKLDELRLHDKINAN